MSKETPFFKFDAKSWLAGNIQFCTLAEKGLFIDLCAMYWDKKKPLVLDDRFRVRYRGGEATLRDAQATLENLQLIVKSEAGITVPFLDTLMKERSEFIEKCRINGKKAHAIQGSPGNKKEERRKKKEDKRNNKEEIREIDYRLELENITKVYFLQYPDFPKEEKEKFFLYYLTINQYNSMPRFKDDKFFNASKKVSNWYSNWKRQNGATISSPEINDAMSRVAGLMQKMKANKND